MPLRGLLPLGANSETRVKSLSTAIHGRERSRKGPSHPVCQPREEIMNSLSELGAEPNGKGSPHLGFKQGVLALAVDVQSVAFIREVLCLDD